ncbi:hypothetical protein NQZ68_012962 [Dissostichus eleginoides]|nr:hypothetical protein NQZ68_012962 [Dissostichus eleginoides]
MSLVGLGQFPDAKNGSSNRGSSLGLSTATSHSDERSSQRAQNSQRAKTAGRDGNDGQRRSHRADKGGNETSKSHGQIPL